MLALISAEGADCSSMSENHFSKIPERKSIFYEIFTLIVTLEPLGETLEHNAYEKQAKDIKFLYLIITLYSEKIFLFSFLMDIKIARNDLMMFFKEISSSSSTLLYPFTSLIFKSKNFFHNIFKKSSSTTIVHWRHMKSKFLRSWKKIFSNIHH